MAEKGSKTILHRQKLYRKHKKHTEDNKAHREHRQWHSEGSGYSLQKWWETSKSKILPKLHYFYYNINIISHTTECSSLQIHEHSNGNQKITTDWNICTKITDC